MPTIRCFHVSPEGVTTSVPDLPAALQWATDDTKAGYVWIDIDQPDAATLETLARPLDIHGLSIEDCLDDEQIPKIEEFPNYVFILMNSYGYQNQELTVGEIDFLLGARFLVSVRGHNDSERNFFARTSEMAEIHEMLERNRRDVRLGPDRLLHVLVDFIVDKKYLACESIEDEITAQEELLLENTAQFRPNELLRLRQCLLRLRKSLSHERDMMSRVCRHDIGFINEKTIFSFRDIHDHLTKFYEFIEIQREMITNLMELHVSLLNNELSVASNHTNAVMKRLTLITTVFMPLTLLAGIGGMSEWSMICGPENWKLSYPAFFLLMGTIGGLNYAWLRWFRWV